jgi:hypothetical protein
MRIESSVSTLSWIPSEAVTGLPKQFFEVGVTHYDDPPPDTIASEDELEALRAEGRFRFANRLAAYIEVEGGRIVDAGYTGGGRMGLTTVSVAGRSAMFNPVALPDLREDPEVHGTSARFVQTTGGRAPIPAPRHVRHPPFFQLKPPDVWTTLALTLHADGTASHELVGASTFPRHWVYDEHGALTAKAGLADFKDWYRGAFGKHTPWGRENSRAYVTAVESALERQLSTLIMRGETMPKVRTVKKGDAVVEQGDPGNELFLLLDGVLDVVVDDEPIAEVGPGAILGERAVLEGGRRTATLRARTKCRLAVAAGDAIDRDALATLSEGHRREHDG